MESFDFRSERHPSFRRLSLRVFTVAATALLFVLAAPLGAAAGEAKGEQQRAFVPASLYEAAVADPERVFEVIVQGRDGGSSGIAEEVRAEQSVFGKVRKFASIAGVATQLRGKDLLRLAGKKRILAITPNAPVRLDGFSSKQRWPYAVGAPKLWGDAGLAAAKVPAIAIVDSGIDATRPDLAGRVREQVTIGVTGPNSPGDGRGHGTFVASIAAGAASQHAGVAPSAPLVSVDVVDDAGRCMTADVIAAADWIMGNKERLGIRVANFSLHASNPGTFMFDPLNKAVERLWFGGVVVVASAGNYGNVGRGVPYAPGNDPFVITVGASDIDGSVGVYDDYEAPWSAYGYTLDGFSKPDLGAPGRYMVGAVPPSATLALERPDRVVAPGYMQLSGTSFSAPIVAGAAAMILAKRPHLTPDQVKGALMLTTTYVSSQGLSMGVGEVNAAAAASVTNPPNPNENLYKFVSSNEFDSQAWATHVSANANWTASNWTASNWTGSNWTASNWTVSNWTASNWVSSNWTQSNWTQSNWTVSLWEE
jgi:serine protease AprX